MKNKICLLMVVFSVLALQPGLSREELPKTATISGFIRDARNGESLTGAVVYPKENPSIGIASNSYGYYSLSLPVGKYSLIVSFLGYKTKLVPVDLKENIQMSFDMEEESIALKEIMITGEKN